MRLQVRNCARLIALGAGCWLGAAAAASLAQGAGAIVAADEDTAHDCRMEVANGGRSYRLTAWGLKPGEPVRLTLVNTDLKPIDRFIPAGADGSWTQFYIPSLPGHHPGPIVASLAGSRCRLTVSFTWQRPSYDEESAPQWATSRFGGS